ncbi:MAG: DUF975 family protein [Clostridia bacterium]|nr:DUF975 family protein [Clostridia bacterium]
MTPSKNSTKLNFCVIIKKIIREGSMTRKELKLAAKTQIKGKVFILLLPLVIVGAISAVIAAISRFTYGVGILALIIEFPLAIGLALFFIKFARDEKSGMEDLFSQFKDFGRMWEQIKACLIRWLYIFLGLLCFVIPGIIIALRYSLLEYVMADQPELTGKQAIEECKKLMKGRIDEIFGLYISFIGWFLLSILTCGILFIYVAPYFTLTVTKYYLAISAEEISAAPASVTAPDAKDEKKDDLF